MSSFSAHLPVNLQAEADGPGEFLRWQGSAATGPGLVAGIILDRVARWLALARWCPYWMKPVYGTTGQALPSEIQCLLWERTDGKFGVLLPLIGPQFRVTAAGAPHNVQLVWSGRVKKGDVLAYASVGVEPFAVIREALAAVAARLGTFQLRATKPVSPFADGLGWCTWDAFLGPVNERGVSETNVHAAGVLDGLRNFARGGVRPAFVILDDGWQDVREERLWSFAANSKFPGGLAPLIARAKAEFGVRHFGVWHALHGYWLGIAPAGPLARRFPLNRRRAVIRTWTGQLEDVSFVAPDAAADYFHAYHAGLKEAGVDLIKVDAQGTLDALAPEKHPKAAALYQRGLQASAVRHFGGQLIHCMANSTDVAYRLAWTGNWRNTDDYYPRKPAAAQQEHVQFNAANALWSAAFSLPDWDSFQTHGSAPEFHAVARAISGGPVYIGDRPGCTRFEILRKIAWPDGRLPRFARPAQLTADRIFTDCRVEPHLLKLTNRAAGPLGVLALFHCHHGRARLKDHFSPAEVPDLPAGAQIAAWHGRARRLELVTRRQAVATTLSPLGWEVVTLAPVRRGVAVLGLLGFYAGAAAVRSARWRGGVYTVELIGGGELGCYARTPPRRVVVGAKVLRWSHDRRTGLLRVSVPQGPAPIVQLHFQ